MDALRMLGSMMEGRAVPAADNRLTAAAQQGAGTGPLGQIMAQFGAGGASQGPGGAPGAGGLSGMLGSLLGQGGSGQAGAGGTMGGIADALRRAVANPVEEAGRNNPAVYGGIGALAGALLGGGKGAIGGGVMAVLGSLAMSALQGAGQQGAVQPGTGQQGAGPSTGTASAPVQSAAFRPGQPPPGVAPQTTGAAATPAAYDSPAELHRKGLLLLRAMVQADKADGQIDAEEMRRLTAKLSQDGNTDEERTYVMNQMAAPIDIPGLAAAVTSAVEAVEVYTASLLAIDVDTQAERDYLAKLAEALRLSPDIVSRVHAAVGVSA